MKRQKTHKNLSNNKKWAILGLLTFCVVSILIWFWNKIFVRQPKQTTGAFNLTASNTATATLIQYTGTPKFENNHIKINIQSQGQFAITVQEHNSGLVVDTGLVNEPTEWTSIVLPNDGKVYQVIINGQSSLLTANTEIQYDPFGMDVDLTD